jgi:hypothetical protein
MTERSVAERSVAEHRLTEHRLTEHRLTGGGPDSCCGTLAWQTFMST